MQVFLLKDVPRVGVAGEIIKVSDGYAHNFLIPKKLGVEITAKNKKFYEGKIKKVEHRKEVIASETSMLAEKIKATTITLKRKLHEDKLYGAVSPGEIVDLLSDKGISISKSQVKFDKSVKAKGTHNITIKLSSRLQPKVTLKVVGE